MSRERSKLDTSVYQTNTSPDSAQSYKYIELDIPANATPGDPLYLGEDDSIRVFSSPDDDVTGDNHHGRPIRWGFNSPSGTRIEIDDSNAKGTIELIQNTGAGLVFSSDGGLFVVSKSTTGISISSEFGDVSISTGGEFCISSQSTITFSTPGDLILDVGGSIIMRSEQYRQITKTSDITIDGTSNTSVTQDNNVIVGGIDRKTVAGDQRVQVTNKRYMDVGSDSTSRVGGNFSHDTTGNSNYTVKGNVKHSANGTSEIFSEGNLKVTSEGSANFKSSQNLNIQSQSSINQKAQSNVNVQSQSDINIKASGNQRTQAGGDITERAGGKVAMQATAVEGKPGINHALYADFAGHAHISNWADKAGQSNTAGSAPDGAGNGYNPKPAAYKYTNLGSAPNAGNASDAESSSKSDVRPSEVPEAEDVIDSLTSARKYPEYPGNGILEHANHTNYGRISGDTTNQAEDVFNEFSSGNTGNVNPSEPADILDSFDGGENRQSNISVQDSGHAIPSQSDKSAKISKYFTMGALTGAKSSHKIPASSWERIAKQHILLANNVLDKIKERFPDIIITSCYRSNSSNHATGKAVDLVVKSRSMTRHAEIAEFASNNLPVDQVFLEKNTSGRTHVHLRLGSGSPRILTCGDPKCRSRQSGIQVAWLSRRSK